MIVQISEETQNRVLEDFVEFLNHKIKKKGTGSFNSPLETFGKITEEYKETLDELHAKNWRNFKYELMDMAVVALWGIMSIEAQPKQVKRKDME